MDKFLKPLLLEFLKEWNEQRKLGVKFNVGICIDFEDFVCMKFPKRFKRNGFIPAWLERTYFEYSILPFNQVGKGMFHTYSEECWERTIGDNQARIAWVVETIKELEKELE